MSFNFQYLKGYTINIIELQQSSQRNHSVKIWAAFVVMLWIFYELIIVIICIYVCTIETRVKWRIQAVQGNYKTWTLDWTGLRTGLDYGLAH